MQGIGYLVVNGEKILVLSRVTVKGRKRDNGYISLKMRKSGKDGFFLLSESQYLEDAPDLVEALKNGDVLCL